MNHKDEKQIIAKHIHEIVGGKPQFVHYNDKKNESLISIMLVDDIWQDVIFYSTIGLSNYSIGLTINEFPLRAEFMFTSFHGQEQAAAILSTCAFNIINSHYKCMPGTIFYDVISFYVKDSDMKHIMFVPPFLWEENYCGLTLADKVIEWLLAVPISEKEANYAEEYGSDALEVLFEKEQIDFFDLYRKSVL